MDYPYSVVFFIDWGLVDRSQRKESKRERLISLGLCGKPIRPLHRTCTAHKGTGCPLNEVLKARAEKWARQVSRLQGTSWRRKEGCGRPKSLMEQGCFLHVCVSLYIVIQGSFKWKIKSGKEQKTRHITTISKGITRNNNCYKARASEKFSLWISQDHRDWYSAVDLTQGLPQGARMQVERELTVFIISCLTLYLFNTNYFWLWPRTGYMVSEK